MKYFWTSLAIIAVVIAAILVGRSQWFTNLFNPKPKEGSSCLDNSNNPGIITNGACKPTPPPPPPPGNETMQRMSINAPETFVAFRGKFCLPIISIPQYPGFVYILTKTDKFYCYYTRQIDINFPSIQPGLFVPASSDRQVIPDAMAIPLYTLCGSKTFVFPTDVDPIKVQSALTNIKSEFQKLYNQGYDLILNVILNPISIAPGGIVTLALYAKDCNSDIAKTALKYINELH